MVGGLPSSRRRGKIAISEQDYVVFPLPRNLSAAPYGDCLIWVCALNKDGYGTGTFQVVRCSLIGRHFVSAEDMREKMCSTCVIAPTAFSQATCMTVASWITLTTGVCDSTISQMAVL